MGQGQWGWSSRCQKVAEPIIGPNLVSPNSVLCTLQHTNIIRQALKSISCRHEETSKTASKNDETPPPLDIKAEWTASYNKAELHWSGSVYKSSVCKAGSCPSQRRRALWPSHLLPPCLLITFSSKASSNVTSLQGGLSWRALDYSGPRHFISVGGNSGALRDTGKIGGYTGESSFQALLRWHCLRKDGLSHLYTHVYKDAHACTHTHTHAYFFRQEGLGWITRLLMTFYHETVVWWWPPFSNQNQNSRSRTLSLL